MVVGKSEGVKDVAGKCPEKWKVDNVVSHKCGSKKFPDLHLREEYEISKKRVS